MGNRRSQIKVDNMDPEISDKDMSQEFYTLLTENRASLADFLVQHGSYDKLKIILRKIEEERPDHLAIVKDLLLGRLGYEVNKQKAIYELPTKELINLILVISHLLGVNQIEEVCAGTGIMARLLEMRGEISVVATDGYRWAETVGKPTYTNVQKKLLLEYAVDVKDYSQTLFVVSWFPKNAVNDFATFLTRCKPLQIAIIGNSHDSNLRELYQKAHQMQYRIVQFPCKQICYQDYFKANKFFPEECCRSSVTLLLSPTVPFDPNIVVENCDPNTFCKSLSKYTDKMMIQDLMINEILPSWAIPVIGDSVEYQKLVEMCTKVIADQYNIPKYITCFDEFEFWFKKRSHNKFPKNITERDKFLEYRNFIERLGVQGGFVQLKDEGFLSDWVPNAEVAEQFFWLDFSTNNKSWKESLVQFQRELGRHLNVGNNNMLWNMMNTSLFV